MNKKLLLTGWLLLCLLQTTIAQAQTDTLGPANELTGHPRILLLAEEENSIKRNIDTDTVWRKLHAAIVTEAKAIISLPPIERIQIGRRLLDKSREALRRLFFLSYAWRLTRDASFAQRAEKEMQAIAAFSDWNPSHFLDVAEMTMAMAIGYDWLYDQLSAASRQAIKVAILEKGIRPSLDPKNNSWLTAEHNWNQVCNAGITYGAMAIFEDEPALARSVINRALRTITRPMADYAPDGAYPEGYGYWGYGTSFNVLFISAIEKALGHDAGLNKLPGFLQTAGYLEHMTGPSGKPFNYSDAGQGGGLQPAMFWFAKRNNDPSLLWVERSRLLDRPASDHVNNRLLPAIMLWGAGMGLNNIHPPAATTWVGKGKNPVALMRTSWTDPKAIFVGFKAGSVSVNHAHMDIGSFVMEADGIRWAMDFGMQDYESLESKGIKLFGRTQDAERWSVFRYTNLVHNTLAVNGQLQKVTGYAPILSATSGTNDRSATADLSAVYAGQLAKAIRHITIRQQQYVAITDEVTTTTAATIRWTLLTPATVTISGKQQVTLSKDGKTWVLDVKAPGKVTMRTWSTDPPHDYDAPNPGTTLTGFEVELPANTKAVLEVTLQRAKSLSH